MPNDPLAITRFTQIKQAYDVLMKDDEPESVSPKANFKGADVYTEISATLEQIFNKRVIHVKAAPGSSCLTCHGTGKKKSDHPIKCVKCNGEGYLKVSKGLMRSKQKCVICNGKGEFDTTECNICGGSGINPLSEGISVVIPDYIQDGETVVFHNMGILPKGGGKRGDLYVTLKLEPHPRFKKQGIDLMCVIEVPFIKLCLGGTILIKGLDRDELSLNIPPVTANKAVMTIPNAGTVDKDGNRGRMVIMLQAKLPSELSDKQNELLKKFQEIEDTRSLM
jgi:molecular chaperone DnaJ